MSNPFYQAMGGNVNPLGNFGQLVQKFQQFKTSFQGDPKAEVEKMLQSGGYSRDDGYSREDGYSRGGDWDASIRGTYGRGSSYRRKRDSMGRYSRDDGYSRDGHAKDVIERMMQDTDDPNVKEALRQCMHVVEKG